MFCGLSLQRKRHYFCNSLQALARSHWKDFVLCKDQKGFKSSVFIKPTTKHSCQWRILASTNWTCLSTILRRFSERNYSSLFEKDLKDLEWLSELLAVVVLDISLPFTSDWNVFDLCQKYSCRI
mmetsp:Transcript_2127/g.2925  ORF Transcript_2127/g.2925 Transcript_2127/m.2925 type:complete len:124 (-) Transcript_2127:32-403(-)